MHPENITKKDWVILLEVGTIVGTPAEKIRVAVATLDKTIVTKYNIGLRKHTTSFWKGTILGFMRCILSPALQVQLR